MYVLSLSRSTILEIFVRKHNENITNIIKKHETNKLVLIGPESCRITLKSESALRVFSDSCSLKYCSKETENSLLNREIDFQGYNSTLDSLLNSASNLKSLVCNDFLCILARKQEIKIGKKFIKKIDCSIP